MPTFGHELDAGSALQALEYKANEAGEWPVAQVTAHAAPGKVPTFGNGLDASGVPTGQGEDERQELLKGATDGYPISLAE